jgi:hypothetical protein
MLAGFMLVGCVQATPTAEKPPPPELMTPSAIPAIIATNPVNSQATATFTPAEKPEEGLFSSITVNEGFGGSQDARIIRSRFVIINFNMLLNADGTPKDVNALQNLKLNLFDDTTLNAQIESLESVSPGSISFLGHVEGVEYSSVVLVVENGLMSGNISMPAGFYQVRYIEAGVHAIYQIDQSAFPSESEPISP